MHETILRAHFEGVFNWDTFAILEVFCGYYCSMISVFVEGKKVEFIFSTLFEIMVKELLSKHPSNHHH